MLGLASTTRDGRAFNDTFDLAGDLVGVVLGEVSPDAGDALARATLIRHALRAYLEAGLARLCASEPTRHPPSSARDSRPPWWRSTTPRAAA